MRRLIFLIFILGISSLFAEDVKFRSGIFLHHSTGGNIWGPNGSNTSIPDEIDNYNANNGYTGDDACSMNQAGWPDNPWDNNWYRWHNIFDGVDATADIEDYLDENRIIVIKSCFPSSEMSGIGSSDDMSNPTVKSLWNYKWHWRSFLKVMQEHPENFFVIWTNAPLVPNATNTDEAELSHQFCDWAKNILGAGLDDEFGPLPKNVYVFDFFHKLVDENYMMDTDYSVDEWDSHPNSDATELVAPQFVEEIFDAAIDYEVYYNSMRNRVNFQLQNISAEGNGFSAELWAFPDEEIGWDVGSSNIVVNYNHLALSSDDYAGSDASGIDSDLESEGYSITQTNAGKGKVSLNIMKSSPFLNKSEPFKIADINWDVLNSIDYHDLSIDIEDSEIFNENSLQLIYNCGTQICYGVYQNNNGLVGGTDDQNNLVSFSVKNRYGNEDDYSAEIWAYVPDEENGWDVGAGNIVLNYNANALTAANYNGIEITDADSELIDEGYFLTQTVLSGGRVSLNIMKSSEPFINVTGWIKLGTLKWDVVQQNLNDGLHFNVNISEIFNGLENQLEYGCNNTSCYGIIDPDDYFIDGPCELLSAPEIVFPANNSQDIVVNPVLDWGDVTEADSYDLQVSTQPAFISTTISLTGLTDNKYSLEGLTSNTKYFWRIRSVNSEQTSNWNTAVFETVWDVPNTWDPPSTAGHDATITAEADLEPKIGERDFIPGDAIGVFFSDDDDELRCGGYGIWNENDLDIIIYSDDPGTDEKDGFGDGEEFLMKVWDSKEGIQYDAEFTIRDGDPTAFQEDGLSYLETFQGITEVTQIIDMTTSWNIISGYVIPENDDITVIIEPIESDLLIIKDVEGDMYFPSLGVNTLGNWNYLEGYKTYMYNATSLEITGLKVKPEDTEIVLNNGWRILSYLRDSDMDVATAVESIEDQFLIIKDVNGNLYFPSLGVQTLNALTPGLGYMIYMTEQGTLTYPSNSTPRKTLEKNTPLAEILIPPFSATGNNCTVILEFDDEYEGMEVGAFSRDGLLLGSGKINNGYVAMTVWGDDVRTDMLDGAKEMELIEFMLLTDNGNLIGIKAISINELISETDMNDIYYQENAIFMAKSIIKQDGSLKDMIQCYPNPTVGKFSISITLAKPSDVFIEVYNSNANRIFRKRVNKHDAGNLIESIDLSEQSSGAYFLSITINEEKYLEKVFLIK